MSATIIDVGLVGEDQKIYTKLIVEGKALAAKIPWVGIGGTIMGGAYAGLCGIISFEMFMAGAGALGFFLGVLYAGFACLGIWFIWACWTGNW